MQALFVHNRSDRNGKLFNAAAFCQMLQVNVGALFVFGKGSFSAVYITVNLPAAAGFAFIPPIDETVHILGGIAEKKTDFMREFLLLIKTGDQAHDAFAGIFTAIASVRQQTAGGLMGQIF